MKRKEFHFPLFLNGLTYFLRLPTSNFVEALT